MTEEEGQSQVVYSCRMRMVYIEYIGLMESAFDVNLALIHTQTVCKLQVGVMPKASEQ